MAVMLVRDIARYLQLQGYGTLATNLFLDYMPADPDDCTSVNSTGGVPSDGKRGYDTKTFQIRVRATYSEDAYNKANAIYSALHGLHSVTLPLGTYIVNCLGLQPDPVSIGQDEKGRQEYTQNYQIRVRNITLNRE